MPLPQEILDKFRPNVAWTPFYPTGTGAWNVAKAGHLFRRASFGAGSEQLDLALKQGSDQTVLSLITPPAGLTEFDALADSLEARALDSNYPNQVQAAWIYRLLHSPFPLRERLTLFWHNHFATSNAKVNNLRLMARQLATIRKHALGNFAELLQAMTFDPAMLIWLDSDSNKAGSPNENYAREVFELFSLGVGHYSEKDIQEAARALTGWSTSQDQPTFKRADHDPSEKTIFGQTGPWAAGDVVRLALERRDCSRFIVRKFFREFVSETTTPSDSLIEPLADEFRIRNYDISWLMHTLLRSWVFYSPAAINQRIKSPVEFLVGTLKMLSASASPTALAEASQQLGQTLYYPPGVKGWDGAQVWINSSTLLARQNLSFDFAHGQGLARLADPAKLAAKHNLFEPADLARFFTRLFLQSEEPELISSIVDQIQTEVALNSSSDPRVAAARTARLAAHITLSLPEFQLC